MTNRQYTPASSNFSPSSSSGANPQRLRTHYQGNHNSMENFFFKSRLFSMGAETITCKLIILTFIILSFFLGVTWLLVI